MTTLLKFNIFIILLFSIFGCESCRKEMIVHGVVTDQNGNSVMDVKVFCCTNSESDQEKAITAVDGSYRFSVGNLGGYAGATVWYKKDGFKDFVADEFSEQEAGIERCGTYEVMRNATLSREATR